MLHRSHLMTALRAGREEFVNFERAWRDEVQAGAERLRELSSRTSGNIRESVGATKAPGALPSGELDYMRGMVVPFGIEWRSHEEARRWAVETLRGRVTFAADGSQIMPGREISMPVAGVQVAWFENPHVASGVYEKDALFSIITPNELMQSDGGQASPEQVVNFRRFEMETQAICAFIERHRGWRARGERVPLAFLDGTFLISSARQHTENKFFAHYAEAILKLVRFSAETEVPVVGYIDQSYARDLVNLLDVLDERAHQSTIYDAQLLAAPTPAHPALLTHWGDRTVFSYCLREGLVEDFRDDRNEPLVGFVYLQTTADAAPARLDIPTWIYEAGLLDEVIDTARAECVVGNGYPYAVETADAAAVMTSRDREHFLRAMQDFAREQDFAFHVSRKSVSKAHRR